MPDTVTPRDFDSAQAVLGRRQSRKIANNTYLRRVSDDMLTVELHGHAIIIYRPSHTELDSCGWHTKTTWDRLSRFTTVRVGGGRPAGVQVWPSREQPSYSGTGTLLLPDWDAGVPFFDGIRVSPDGTRILNARTDAERIKTYSGFDRMRAEGDLPGVNYYGIDMGYTRPNEKFTYQKAMDL